VSIFSRIVDWVTTPYTVYLIIKDPAVSPGIKWRAVLGLLAIFAYVISPFSLIQYEIPLIGCLDDIAVIAVGFALLRLITPGMNIVEKRNTARKGVRKILFWIVVGIIGAVLIALTIFSLFVYAIIRLIAH
jgi:uncharacterized membrane protein YkvA (DUF1232 family)